MSTKGVTTVIAVGQNRTGSEDDRLPAAIGTDHASAPAVFAGPRHWVVA